jgi:hypothetical protein
MSVRFRTCRPLINSGVTTSRDAARPARTYRSGRGAVSGMNLASADGQEVPATHR